MLVGELKFIDDEMNVDQFMFIDDEMNVDQFMFIAEFICVNEFILAIRSMQMIRCIWMSCCVLMS